MAPVSGDLVVDTGIHAAALESHGTSIEQTSSQVRLKVFHKVILILSFLCKNLMLLVIG